MLDNYIPGDVIKLSLKDGRIDYRLIENVVNDIAVGINSSVPNKLYPDNMNMFNLGKIDESNPNTSIIIYRGTDSSRGCINNTYFWIENDEFHDNNYTQPDSVEYVCTIGINKLRDYYNIVDACRGFDYHLKHSDSPKHTPTGGVYEIINPEKLSLDVENKVSAKSETKYLVMMRISHNLDDNTYVNVCLRICKNGYSKSIFVDEKLFNEWKSNQYIKYIGFIKPNLFKIYFDMFHNLGNPYIPNMQSVMYTDEDVNNFLKEIKQSV